MNSFRLLVLLYTMIITSLALAVDDFNSMPPRARPKPAVAKPDGKPERRPNRVATQSPKKKKRRARRPKPVTPSATLVTDPTDFGPPAEVSGSAREPSSTGSSQ